MADGERLTVAVLGAGGTMGLPMARNIGRAGMAVRAWNRTRERAEPLREDGAEVLDTAAEAARGADVVLTMLADADAVHAAMTGEHGALAGAADGTSWLQTSTIGLEGTERCAQLADAHGLVLVDAPVLGTRQPAEQAQLVILASGPEEARPRADRVFDAIGQRTLWLGAAGTGTRLKVVTNAWIVAVVEGAAETIALAEGLGVDPRRFLEAIEGGTLDLPYLRLKAQQMLEREFPPAFKLRLAAKDARLAVDAAQRHGLDLPVVRAIAERMAQGAREHGDEDLAATFLTSAPS